MFEENDNTSADFGDLFEDTPEPEAEAEETEAEEADTEPEAEESEESEDKEPSEESEESEEAETPEEPEDKGIIATIEIDGQQFPLDEMKVQKIAEQYVEVAQQNKVLAKDREQVVQVMGIVENIRNGVDIDESMKSLGVDFDALIRDKVKDFIRRSTMSSKERELEDANKEREILRKKIAEREAKEKEEMEAKASQEQATLIIDTVNMAVSKIPEQHRKEIQLEVFGAIERRIRSGGMAPSSKAIENAVQTVYNRKYKSTPQPVTKKQSVAPKPLKNSPKPVTMEKKKSYNAVDYNDLFR